MKESEMERIAREAREFRENETRRIAAEREETRRAKELRKQLELARIALESSKFLKDTAEEQKAMARIKELEQHLLRQDKLRMLSGVSEKAQVLSEREELERRRAEEREEEERRKKESLSSRFSHIVSEYPSGEARSEEADGGFSSSGPTVAFDALKNQFENVLDMADNANTSGTRVLKKLETVYYDANSDLSRIDSTAGAAIEVASDQVHRGDFRPKPCVEDILNPVEIGIGKATEAFSGVNKDGEVIDGGLLSQSSDDVPPEIELDDIPTTRKTLKKRETIYYDAQTTLGRLESTESGASGSSFMPLPNDEDKQEDLVVSVANRVSTDGNDTVEFEQGESRALTMLLEGQNDYLSHKSETEAGEMSESLMSRRTGRTARKPLAGKSKSDDDDLEPHSSQVACFEIPVEYNSTDGNFIMGRDAHVSLSTYMAPSRVDGNWSGVIEGKASVGPSAGLDQALGSVTLDYAANQWSKLSLGMIRGHQLFHPLITIGGSLMQRGSMLGITFYHNASFLHSRLLEHSMYSIAFRHAFAKSRCIITSEISRRQDLSLTVSNPKMSSTISWSLRKPENSSARLEVRPTLSEDRVAHIFGECRSSGIWQVGASLVQSLHSSIATVGIGVRLYSTRGLEWLISWTRGEATIRIPVVVSRTTNDVHLAQVLYFAMLSFLIQEAIAEIWGWKHPNRKPSGGQFEKSKPAVSTSKSRHDAEVQQGLMARQAKRKLREETYKNGLVIHEATYTVGGGATWQVTIPLQFWVNQSSLTLPPKPKSQLLGFYSVSSTDSSDSSEAHRDLTGSPISTLQWWKNVFRDLTIDPITSDRPEVSSSGPIPTLEVLYEYQGQRYQIKISDQEELVLPNPRGNKV